MDEVGIGLRLREVENEITLLELDLIATLVKRQRLRVEVSGDQELRLPRALQARATAAGADGIVENERAILESRAEIMRSKLDALQRQKGYSEQEAATLQESIDLQSAQEALIQEEVDNLRGLAEQGLALRPRLLALEREQLAMQRAGLDARSYLARARQRASELDEQMLRVRSDFQADVLQNLQVAETRLKEIELRLAAQRRLLAQLTGFDAVAFSDADVETRFSIERGTDAGTRMIDAGPTTALRPGDVVHVDREPTAMPSGLGPELRDLSRAEW